MIGPLESFSGLVLDFVPTVVLRFAGLDLGDGLALVPDLTLRLDLALVPDLTLRLDLGFAATVAGAVGLVDLLLPCALLTVEALVGSVVVIGSVATAGLVPAPNVTSALCSMAADSGFDFYKSCVALVCFWTSLLLSR